VRILPASIGFSLRESRLIALRESSFGDHMKDYGHDLKDTYISGRKGTFDRVAGAAMIPVSAILEGPDQIFDGILGRKYEAPAGVAGRTRRDIKLLFKDVFTLHPIRAAADAWKLATSDLILDSGDLVTGSRINKTRSSVSHALAA
jgi:hypothetical protein